MAIDSSPGSSTANSYVTIAEADTYFSNHYNLTKATAWAALTTPRKEMVLKRACQVIESLRVLDTEYGFGSLPVQLIERGVFAVRIHRLELNQQLNFPRNIDLDPEDGRSPLIPQKVPDAQCEQAAHLLAFDDSSQIARLSGLNYSEITAGPVTVIEQYSSNTGTSLAPMAWELMREFVRPTARMQRA